MNKLTEIKEALSKVTQGKWTNEKGIIWCESVAIAEVGTVFGSKKFDGDLIANAPEYITYLLSLLEEKDKEIKEKDKALSFYANEDVWLTTDIDGTYAVNPFEYTSLDGPWDVARKALNTSSNNEGK